MNFEKQKCVLRLELIAGYRMLLNKDQQKCFIEFKLDGETKQSETSTKMDQEFGQVFHFHVNQNKNAKRELQVLLCNINRGGYLNKQTLASKLLSDLDFELNKQFQLDLTSEIQGKNSVKVSLTYSFINNLFIDDVKGEVIVRLQNMLTQQKGILSMTLTKGFTKLTGVPGASCIVKNESPYCKLTLLYYLNLDIKDYSKEKQIELSKKSPDAKQDIYLCDQRWVSQPDGTLNVLLEKVNLKNYVQLKLQFTLKRQSVQQPEQLQQVIQPTKKFLAFYSIKLDGFPNNELPNAKYYLRIHTPNCLFLTHLNNVPDWNCEFGFYEQDFVVSVHNYNGDSTQSSLLAIFQSRAGIEGKLSDQYLRYLRDYYGQNINEFKKLTENLNLRIEYNQEPFSSPIIDNPEGIVNLQDSDYCVNEFSGGYKAFQISSIYDYVQIRKYRENKIEEAFDTPVYKITDKITFYNQEIEYEFEPIKRTKQVIEEKNDKSNFVKITLYSIKIQKNEFLQLKIQTDDFEFQTSKNKGIYFGQSFICKYPNKLQFQLKNLTDTDVIKDIYSSFVDLGQFEFNTYEAFINVLLSGSGKQCLLTLKLEFSGRINEKNNLTLTPIVNFPATNSGFFFVRVLHSYRFFYDQKQVKSENNSIEFEKIIWAAEDVWKPIRFQIFYQQGSKEEDIIQKGDFQFQAIDLMWRNRAFVQVDFFKIKIEKEVIDLPEQLQQAYRPIQDALTFIKFTPLNFQCNAQRAETVDGYAFQLAHNFSENVDRLRDTKNFEYSNSVMEFNRTELNTLKYSASTHLIGDTLPISLLNLIKDEVRVSYGKIAIDEQSRRSQIHYYENRDHIPQILKFRLDLIQHIKISHTSIYEILVTNIQIEKQFKNKLKLHIGQTQLINYPWIKDGIFEGQAYKETVPPIKFEIEEIESYFEFVLFAESLIYRRYVVNLSTLQFLFNSDQTEGTYEYESDSFKCLIVVKQQEGKVSSELKVSFQTMTKMKSFVTKFIKYKFSNNFDSLEFSSKLRYSFITSRQTYLTALLKRSEGQSEGQFLYIIITPELRFPRPHSVDKIFLGNKELYIRKREETRSEEDLETVLETKVKIRKIYVPSIEPTQKLTCLTKEGKIIEFDQKYLVYKEIKSNFTIGRFEISIFRIMKDVKKDYENKFIAPDMRIKLKYNKQTQWILGITEQGLMVDGIFQNCAFYVSDVTELLKIQIYVHNYLVAEGEYCVPLLKQQFVQQIFRIIYTNNDLVYFFHQKLNLKNIWIMGQCSFQQMNWKKIFLRFKKMIINFDDEDQNTIRNYSVSVKNESLSWLSQIYSTTRKSIEIEFQRKEIVDYIISDGEKDNYFKILFKMNANVLIEKILSLKPFIQRNVKDYPFEIQLSDKVSIQTVIEVSQKFKSEMQKKPKIQVQKFDFRKTGYQDIIIRMLNDVSYLERGLSEIFEFLMYNTSDKYDPNIIIKICRSIICVFNDKIKLTTLCTQCMASVYISQRQLFAVQANHMHLMLQLQELILIKDKQFKKLLDIPYFEEYLPQAQSQIDNLELTEGELIQFLKSNKYKYQENLFDESVDRLAARTVLGSFKIFGNLIAVQPQVAQELIQYLYILNEAYHQYDDYNIDIGTAFTILINSFLNIMYDSKQAKLESSEVLENSSNLERMKKNALPNSQSFYDLLIIFFDTVEKASQQNFVAILITMNNLVKILNREQESFLKLILKYLIRSLVIQQDLELHIGIVVEYFQPTNKELIRKALKGVDLEYIALKIAEQEFQNSKPSNVLSNLFDILIQSIELGEENILDQQSQQLFKKLLGFLKGSTPKLEANKIKIEKFLIYMEKRVERTEKLLALKGKEKQKGQEPETIVEQKKRNMERFMISKLPW